MVAERFKPFSSLAGVGTVLAAWLVVFNLTFATLDGAGGMSWLPDRTSGIGYLLESKQRVDSAEAYLGSRPANANPPLVAIVGISDVREGTRLEILSEKARNNVRFIGVAGAGAGFASVEEQASLILNSKLRPAAVVIGISPMHMIEVKDFNEGAAKAAAANEDGLIESTKAEVRGALWFIQRRSDLVGWLDRILLKLKTGIRHQFGQETSTDPRSPWRPLLRTLKAEHYPEEVLRRGLGAIEASGGSELSTLERSRLPFSAAGTLVRRFEDRGARVIIMVMPRHPWLEAIVPPLADQIITLRLRAASGDQDLKVFDYSDTVPASGFIDLVHLNTVGGEVFSRHLADDLLKEVCQGNPTCSRLESRPLDSR
jgi:hypothetical protein